MYYVYKSPFEIPRVTTSEFFEQVHVDQTIGVFSNLFDAQQRVLDWYYDQIDEIDALSEVEFAAHMGLSS